MSLAAALAKPPTSRRSCGVGLWLASLPKADQAAAHEAFKDPAWMTTQLFDVFAGQGFAGQVTIITRHRLGRCACR